MLVMNEKGENVGWRWEDKFQITREGEIITYLKNDRVIYTSTTPSTGKLVVDVAIYKKGGSIKNAMICG